MGNLLVVRLIRHYADSAVLGTTWVMMSTWRCVSVRCWNRLVPRGGGDAGQGSFRHSILRFSSLGGGGGGGRRGIPALLSEPDQDPHLDQQEDGGWNAASSISSTEEESAIPPVEERGVPPVQVQRSLRVAVIGLPNAGKSTLVNQLVQKKVLPVSPKVHTTTRRATGVFTEGETQIVLIDTPGVVSKKYAKKMGMSRDFTAGPVRSVMEADIVMVLVDAVNKFTRDRLGVDVLRILRSYPHLPSILVLNKVDLLKKKAILLKLAEVLTGSENPHSEKIGYLVRKLKDHRNSPEFKAQIKEELKELEAKVAAKNERERAVLEELRASTGLGIGLKETREERRERRRRRERGIGERGVCGDAGLSLDTRTPQCADSSCSVGGSGMSTQGVDGSAHPSEPNGTTTADGSREGQDPSHASGEAREGGPAHPGGLDEGMEGGAERVYYPANSARPAEEAREGTDEICDPRYEARPGEDEVEGDTEKTHDLALMAEGEVRGGGGGPTRPIVEDGHGPSSAAGRDGRSEGGGRDSVGVDREKTWSDRVLEVTQDKWPYFSEVFMLSAMDGNGAEKLKDYLFDNAKQRRWDCAMSELTDQSALEVVQDVIREKLCKHTDKELPYVVQQENVVWDREESGVLSIYQYLYCGKKSRAAILIGHKGGMIRTIKEEAREDLEELFQCPVDLTLHVKK